MVQPLRQGTLFRRSILRRPAREDRVVAIFRGRRCPVPTQRESKFGAQLVSETPLATAGLFFDTGPRLVGRVRNNPLEAE